MSPTTNQTNNMKTELDKEIDKKAGELNDLIKLKVSELKALTAERNAARRKEDIEINRIRTEVAAIDSNPSCMPNKMHKGLLSLIRKEKADSFKAGVKTMAPPVKPFTHLQPPDLRCQDCGCTQDVRVTNCPYASEIHNKTVKVTICSRCRQRRSADI